MTNIYHPHWKSLALFLWDADIIKVNTDNYFELTDGSLSPIYFDIRQASPDLYDKIGQFLSEAIRSYDTIYDGIAGIPKAATPLAKSFAKSTSVNTVRLAKKDDGSITVINTGECHERNIILLIDDVATTAKTKFRTIDALVAKGFVVANVIVVCDRQQGAEKELAKVGCELLSLLTIRQLLNIGLEKYITKKEFRHVIKYLSKFR